MATYSNLIELLQARATQQGSERAYTFLEGGEREARVLTYGELERAARAVAVVLREAVGAGDRALLVYPPGLDFVIAFLGCQMAGVVAVPVLPPRRSGDWARFESIASDCAATAVCVIAEHAPFLEARVAVSPALSGVVVVSTDAIDGAAADRWRAPAVTPDDLSFLQYTSGSTGVPKGVMVSHRNLLHNEASIQAAFGNDERLVGVNWLPQYHDMGLIGCILQPIYVGGRSVLMSPLHFLQHPMRWLKAIAAYRGTQAGAPNFAYALCASRATDAEVHALDLSTWRVAFNGAEPVRLATLERFAARFAPSGFRREAFYPCYGLAESTLFVTGVERGAFPRALHVDASRLEQHALVPVERDAPGSRALVGCGKAVRQTLRIVSPATGEVCEDGQVGEIWVAGPSVARGYWGRAEATREAFAARIAPTGEGPFLRTGDLGVLHDGELFVTGRMKELIIIDGRNHYPQDIEETVQSGRPALRGECGAAFAIDLDGAERLVVVQEVARGHAGIDLERLATEVRASVAATHGVSIHTLLFVPERTVEKTTSGKIRRSVVRDRMLGGSLKVLGRSEGQAASAAALLEPARPCASRSETERTIAALIAPKVGRTADAIDVDLSFSAYGLDSRALVGLSGELEIALGRRLEPHVFYNHSTVAALARWICGDDPGEGPSRPASLLAAPSAEPIAIVGMACRFPGAPDLTAFWELLRTGKDAITEIPASRWDVAHWYDPDPSAPGKMATRWGGFIDDVAAFDADFFGTSPREAEAMDPQQRIMLELAWHALEDAGMRPEALRGSRTGVLVGISGSDYARLQAGGHGLLAAHAGTGNALSIVPNRISYFFDFRGPSLAVDTACSSSLTALHAACAHLRSGECDQVLVGGVNLILAPDVTVSFSQNRMMAADGRCKAFGKAADGYVRSEGAGVVVLKRLSDAVAAGDRIHAVIAGSACNQDGRSNGLTAPSGGAQRAVVREALENAGWRPADVHMVETHGTGTRLGDPIEAEALGAIYGQDRDARSPLVLGAVKSQIGHLEAAAGMAGLIKAALCLEHAVVPANLHASEPSPRVRLDAWRLSLPTSLGPWPAGGAPLRRAGVSAFGFGGTNAHVLLEQAPAQAEAHATRTSPRVHVLPLSARSEAALDAQCDAYGDVARRGADAASLCHVAAVRRAHFREARRAVVGTSSEELAAALTRPMGQERSERAPLPRRGVAFLFTGQGAQYVGMGRALYASHPTFRAALDACDEALGVLGDGPRYRLLDLLHPASERAAEMDARLAETDGTQPALFALEYALAKLWLSWGVTPEVVMGHSLGEIAAAAVAGVFSLEDGLALVHARGRLMKALPEAGGMLAVFAHERDLDELLPRLAGKLSIGAYNGPGQIVLSGAVRELDKARVFFKQHGIETKALKVSHAFHSALMDPMLEAFRAVAERVRYHAPSIPVISNLTGQRETTRLASADYWVEHVRAPVRFAQGIATLARMEVGVLLEIGPRPVLLGMARRMLADADYRFQPTLDAATNDDEALARAVAALYEAGVTIDWPAFHAPFAAPFASAPLYPFERKPFWFTLGERDGATHARLPSGAARPGAHPLLGSALASPRRREGDRHFEAELRLPGPAFFRVPVEPGERRVSLLAFLEIALEAQRELFPGAPRTATDLALEGLLQIPRGDGRRVQTLCERDDGPDGTYRMEVWTDEEVGGWRRIARATLGGAGDDAGPALTSESLASLRARIQEPLDVDAWYETTRESGLLYCTSPYAAIRQMWWAPSEVLAVATPREEDDVDAVEIWLKHSMWNVCNQVMGALCPRDGRGTYFPVSLERVRFLAQPGRALVLHGRLRGREADASTCVVDVTAYDEDGVPIAVVEGVRMVPDETNRTPRSAWRSSAPEARKDFLVASLRRIVARTLRRSPAELPLTASLPSLGLDSLTAIEIVTRVEQGFEVGLDLAALQEGANVEELAVMLGERLAEAEGWRSRASGEGAPLVELNRGDPRVTPLFLLHPIGGSVFCYQELARHLGSQPLVGIQSPSLAGSPRTFTRLEELAAHHLTLIQGRQARGPYRLAGWSMGGVLAFEIARQLEAKGEDVECLLLLDALAPGELPVPASRGAALVLLARSLGIDPGDLGDADPHDGNDDALETLAARGRAEVPARRTPSPVELRRLLAEVEKNLALLGGYEGHAYKGTATVLRAEIPLWHLRPDASGHDWGMWLAGVDALHTVPGSHFSLLSGSHVYLTASYVRKALNALATGAEAARSDDPRPSLTAAAPRARPPHAVVISPPVASADGVLRAELLVDEAHPYFFDHPLDHVSGILMMEGLLQLIEEGRVARDGFLRHVRLTFPRFCEKDRPIVLELPPPGHDASRACRAVQAGVQVCTLKFDAAGAPHLPRGRGADAPLRHRATPPAQAEARLVHKSRAENVLIAPWVVEGGRAHTSLLAPPAAHQLEASASDCYSPLYALETARQFVTGLAHDAYGVPLGMPMNLVGVELVLDAPLRRDAELRMHHVLKPLPPPGAATFAHFAIDVTSGEEVLGHCRITAQLLTREAYLHVRQRAVAA